MTIQVIIAILVVLVMIAGFGAWLNFSVERTRRHQLQSLSESACPVCGTHYGLAAAERARQEYFDRCVEAQRQRPDLRINFVRYWEIRCAQCGAEAQFHYETESLVTKAA
jgi:hypothetical protein